MVLDTNVVVSAALLPRSVPRQAFDGALEFLATLVRDAELVEVIAVVTPRTINFGSLVFTGA